MPPRLALPLLLYLTLLPSLAGASAQEAQQVAIVSVAAVNSLSVADSTLEVTLGAGESSVRATGHLEFSTNDGRSFSILVSAHSDGWVFTPAVPGSDPGAFPVLRLLSATATAGTVGDAAAQLIGSDNGAGVAVELVGGISSVAGSVTATFEVSGDQRVVAGTYRTTLSYTLAAP